MNIEYCFRDDWCHLCGTRGEKHHALILFPDNAEHGIKGQGSFKRVCRFCIEKLYEDLKTVMNGN